MKLYIQRVAEGIHLTRSEAAEAMRCIMDGEASDAQIAALLIGLKVKGEQTSELLGFVETMRAKAVRISAEDPDAVDLCGTGGDGLGTFNISTAAAFVVAGAGATVAKHGNRSVSSACGSADILKALGVDITMPPERVERSVNRNGIGFLFAPLFHPAMKHAAKARSELGVKTCFNMLGPMTNPAGVRRQLVGAFSTPAARTMAEVFGQLDVMRVCVVHALDGMDEVSLGAATEVWQVGQSALRSYALTHDALGLPSWAAADLRGGTAEENAALVIGVLNGTPGPHRDVVVANAGLALTVAGKAASVRDGVALAAEAIDTGRALAKLRLLKEEA
jgi:anthranilate phosphoribosyltransferase